MLSVDIEKNTGQFHLKSSFTTGEGPLALLGASGCGKSMTLKCIAGVEKPDRGMIKLGEKVLFDSEKRICLPARKRRVGYLFQNYALFPNMTVRDNILCAAKEREYADSLIERFGLENVAAQRPAELSGGQSQRTALARMLAARPEAILLDEPFSALDNHMRSRMEHEILDILEEFEGPVVLVTHDRNEAFRLAEKIAVMQEGTVVETAEKKAFFDHPETVAAARLTGCKNITALEKKGSGIYARDWGIDIALDRGMPEGITHAGYRAHYFTYTEDKIQENVFTCRCVRVIEDVFSTAVCFRQKGNENDSPDSMLTWMVDNDKWNGIKDRVMSGEFMLKLDPGRMMLLKDVR